MKTAKLPGFDLANFLQDFAIHKCNYFYGQFVCETK